MLNFDLFTQRAQKVPCIVWDHAQFLYALVKWLKPKIIVEVGSWHGGSAIWLGRGLQENGQEENCGHLYCIDDFEKHEDLQHVTVGMLYSNLCDCEVEHLTDILYGKSQDVEWPQKIDMAFIDGDHSLEACEWDVNKAIAQGATCIVVHDTYSTYKRTEGPRQWLKKFQNNPDWGLIEVPFDEGLVVALKKPSSEPTKLRE